MTLSTLATVVFAVTLTQVARALPISQSHRYAVYTPYWHQSPRDYAPDLYPSHKRLGCGAEPCDDRPDELSNSVPFVPGSKRSKNAYRTGWTMGGMPFSVLYMNTKPHIAVRSPSISESLRSLPPNYESLRSLPPNYESEIPPPTVAEHRVEEEAPDIQAEALHHARFDLDHQPPTVIPTRKQYSIIPQLFVSYGWGPLGK